MNDNTAAPSAADVLYGGTPTAGTGTREGAQAGGTPAAPPDFAARRTELDRQREAIAAEAEALRAAERAAAEQNPESAADKLFGDPESLASTYGPQLADALGDLTALAPELAEKRVEILAETSRLYADAAIGPEQAATLHAAFVSSLKNPPSDDQIATWARESRTWLRETLGEDWQQDGRVQRVRQFIDARPALKELLEISGLGDSPTFVKTFLDHANQMRLTPRKAKA